MAENIPAHIQARICKTHAKLARCPRNDNALPSGGSEADQFNTLALLLPPAQLCCSSQQVPLLRKPHCGSVELKASNYSQITAYSPVSCSVASSPTCSAVSSRSSRSAMTSDSASTAASEVCAPLTAAAAACAPEEASTRVQSALSRASTCGSSGARIGSSHVFLNRQVF